MNNIEKIKFGDQEFDLVPAGVELSKTGGTIKFQMGDKTFEEIEAILKANNAIKKIGRSGNTEWSRDDLVYGKFMSRDADYKIGMEADGVTETTAAVMIAVFKSPDLNERVAALEAENAEIKKDNESLKATVDTLVLSNLEV